MYGQYTQPISYYTDSSHSESSFPGALPRSKKKRVPLLGKMRLSSQPVPLLQVLPQLEDMARDEIREGDRETSMLSTSFCDADDEEETNEITEGIHPYTNEDFAENSRMSMSCNVFGEYLDSTDSPALFKDPGNTGSLPHLGTYGSENCKNSDNTYDNLLSDVDDISLSVKDNGLSYNFEHINDTQELHLNHKSRIRKPFDELHYNVPIAPTPVMKQQNKLHNVSLAISGVSNINKLTTQVATKNKNIVSMQSEDERNFKGLSHDEMLVQLETCHENNKENDVNLLARDMSGLNLITPARSNFQTKAQNIDNRISKFKTPARKDVTTEKHSVEEAKSYTPFCKQTIIKSTPLVNVAKSNKGETSLMLNYDKERAFKTPAKNYMLNGQADQKVDESNLLPHNSCTNKTNITFSNFISEKQECQMNVPDNATNSSTSISCSNSKTTREASKDLSIRNGESYSNTVIAEEEEEDKKMEPFIQSKPEFELSMNSGLRQQPTNIPKILKRMDNRIIVNGKIYIAQCILGRGGSSEVYQVLNPHTSQQFAMKRVNLSVAEQPVAEGYLNEIELLRRLQGSESVITMIDFEYVREKHILYVVMEKGETDLSKLIKDISKTNQIPMTTIVHYWTEMLRAVKNIHLNGIIHSDLKPANFLLVRGRLKLIDFGIASSVQSDMTSVFKDTPTGTFNYMSPEAIQDTRTNGNVSGIKIRYKSDIWSLGCILYNLLYGKTPFQHIGQVWAKLTAITNPNHHIDYPDTRHDIPPVLLKAVQLCLTYDSKKRPTAEELLQMPYLNYGNV